jgi:hypothetical protein
VSPGAGRFLRDNAFLVGAVSLPIAIVLLFLLLAAIPRWTVPPPGYDLLLRTTAYENPLPRVAVDFVVLNDRMHVTVREVSPNSYPPSSKLWVFDHRTLNVRQLSVDVPQLAVGETSRTVPIGALAGRRVLAETKAPDGYELQDRSHRGGGLVGDLFGMGRYNRTVSLVNGGRVVKIPMPTQEYQPPAFVGWLMDEGTP